MLVIAAATRTGSVLDRAQYVSWAKALAANGTAAVIFDSEWGRHTTDLALVFEDVARPVPFAAKVPGRAAAGDLAGGEIEAEKFAAVGAERDE